MPPAKRSSASTSKPSSASPPTTRKSSAGKSGAKATATTARKASAQTATQAKSAATKTARSAASGAKATATTAKSGAKATTSRAKAANTASKRETGGDGLATAAAKDAVRPRETVTLSRDRIQATLDAAATRGRVTRKDANDLVAELMRHGRHAGGDVGELLEKGKGRIENATKKVRKAEPVDRIVRGADRARRAAGVGPAFPIIGYDELRAPQVQARVKELSKPDQRKVLNYERKHANRKSVVGALEKSLA